MGSVFEKYKKKSLVRFSQELLERDFDWQNPYEDYNSDFRIFENIAKYFGEDVSMEDMEFFYKFIEINHRDLVEIFEENKKEYIEGLMIPQIKNFKVRYYIDESKLERNFYTTTWESYDKDYVQNAMRDAANEGLWSLYDGQNYDTDIRDSEWIDDVFLSIDEIDSNEKGKIKKENSYINSLDKKSLLELKNLIDKRLRVI